MLDESGIAVASRHVADFFLAARSAKLYSEGSDQPNPQVGWETRRLGAVHLHLTNRCNLECVYCFRESTPRLPVHRTADHFIDVLRRIAPRAAKGLTITFTGGEPLLFPGFESVVEASSQLGYRNLLLTNGTLITKERASFIATHFHEVTISLDGPNESIHAATRGAGNFKGVIRGIERLVSAGVFVRVKVTVAKGNLPYCHEQKSAIRQAPLRPVAAPGQSRVVRRRPARRSATRFAFRAAISREIDHEQSGQR